MNAIRLLSGDQAAKLSCFGCCVRFRSPVPSAFLTVAPPCRIPSRQNVEIEIPTAPLPSGRSTRPVMRASGAVSRSAVSASCLWNSKLVAPSAGAPG